VRDIVRVLTHGNVCIEDFIATRTAAPFSGEQMFHASVQLRVPMKFDVDRLRVALEALANEMMVDFAPDGRGLGDPCP
jgi:glycine cleavage system regulatory protein